MEALEGHIIGGLGCRMIGGLIIGGLGRYCGVVPQNSQDGGLQALALGHLGSILGNLNPVLDNLGPSWATLGLSLEHLGQSSPCLGPVIDQILVVLTPFVSQIDSSLILPLKRLRKI